MYSEFQSMAVLEIVTPKLELPRSGRAKDLSFRAGQPDASSFPSLLRRVGLRSRELSLGLKGYLLGAVKLRQPFLQLLLFDLSLDHRGSEFLYHVLRSLLSEIWIPQSFLFSHGVLLKPVSFLRKPSQFRALNAS